jgi:hypothetical protein
MVPGLIDLGAETKTSDPAAKTCCESPLPDPHKAVNTSICGEAYTTNCEAVSGTQEIDFIYSCVLVAKVSVVLLPFVPPLETICETYDSPIGKM